MMMMTMGSVFTGVVCPVKIGGESFDLQPYQNSPPPIFHWAHAAPTRYRDRSHCRSEPDSDDAAECQQPGGIGSYPFSAK